MNSAHFLDIYLKKLKEHKILLYPTDTIWGIGCHALSEEAIHKIFILKKREIKKSMIILVNNIDMMQEFTSLDLSQRKNRFEGTDTPTTFIIPKAKNLPKSIIASDGTIAFRIPKHQFCISIINKLNGPIISTSANISGTNISSSFQEISNEIKMGVDFIVDPIFDTSRQTKPSSIIQIDESNNEIIIRE